MEEETTSHRNICETTTRRVTNETIRTQQKPEEEPPLSILLLD